MKLSEALRAAESTRWAGSDRPEEIRSRSDKLVEIVGDLDIKSFSGSAAAMRVRRKVVDAFRTGSTANRYLTHLQVALRDQGCNITLPRVIAPPQGVEYLTSEQLALLDEQFKRPTRSPITTCIYVILRDTGCRGFSELNRLTWEDIDWDRKKITFRSKKGKMGDLVPRTVPMTPQVEKATAWLYGHRNGNAPFPIEAERAENMAWFKRWRRVCLATLGRHVKPYSLRHSYAMRLVQADIPIHVIAKMMGHRSLTTTFHYLHEREADSSTILEALCSSTKP